ncbi:MAG: CHAD domain-containing protein [Planctomycetes bacterium]|nr:CHAD domain-containing protein [Planctomycetota bacterium]
MKPRRTLRSSRNATLDRLAGRLKEELRKVRKSPANAEAIHDARVAARRLLAAGELWAPHVAPWPGVRDRLPRIVRKLGRVRNLDIAIDLLRKGTKEDAAARKALSRFLRRIRKEERARVAAWLKDRKIDKIDLRMRKVVREVRQKPVLDAPSPPDLAPHFARVMSLFTGRAWEPSSEEAHAIRREARRLRYAHETLEWAYEPEDFQKVVKVLGRIQEMAGEWHDRVILEKFAAKAIRRGKAPAPLAGFLAQIQAESKTLSGKFVRAASELSDLRQLIVGDIR